MRIKIPHVFALLTFVVFACSMLTWVVPSGEFEREERMVGGSERMMVVAGTYETIPKHRTARGGAGEGGRDPIGLTFWRGDGAPNGVVSREEPAHLMVDL